MLFIITGAECRACLSTFQIIALYNSSPTFFPHFFQRETFSQVQEAFRTGGAELGAAHSTWTPRKVLQQP